MNLAWKRWLAGLWAAGSSGVTTAISTNLVAPELFNVYTKKFWICAGASAGVSAMKYIVRTRFVERDGHLVPEEEDDDKPAPTEPQPKG